MERPALLWIALAALAVNLPLGYLRQGTRKFSPAWFLYVHLSVPLIAALRILSRLSLFAVPLFVACAVLGQVLGGRVRRPPASGDPTRARSRAH